MKYIKKEELIEGEIYRHDNGNLVQYLHDANDTQIHGHFIGEERNVFENYNNVKSFFTIKQLKLATSEEKHWLLECIRLNKFITFEEAMKTFVPEYVEWVGNIGSENLGYQTKYTFEKNKIFKTDTELPLAGFQTENWLKHLTVYPNNYKPSTKEAYDAQFIVKEPEFVLPEKWCLKITNDNLNFCKALENNELHYKKNYGYCVNGYYSAIRSDSGSYGFSGIPQGFVEITFEQFKKYVLKEEVVEEKVIEPLPQFKVIETIETITKVENNEGNQFFIGDTVKSLNSNQRGKITKFKYSNDKSDIIAITTFQQTNGISINKIEHYIEPKVESINRTAVNIAKNSHYGLYPLTLEECYQSNETLLEKAKRLYPIGTKFKCLVTRSEYKIPEGNITFDFGGYDNEENIFSYVNHKLFHKHYENDKWAEIIEYPHGFKIDDKIKLKLAINPEIHKIIKIEGNDLFYNFKNKEFKILAKNVIKVN